MIYTIEEWIEDYDYATRLQYLPGTIPSDVIDRARDYFYSKYRGDDPIARFARFSQAMLFLDQRLKELSFGRAAVAGESEALVARPLAAALHEYFTTIPDERIDEFPTVEEIKALALKHGA
jgi:hypothetical protein